MLSMVVTMNKESTEFLKVSFQANLGRWQSARTNFQMETLTLQWFLDDKHCMSIKQS